MVGKLEESVKNSVTKEGVKSEAAMLDWLRRRLAKSAMGESDIPTTGKLILLAAAIACFAVGWILSISRLWQESESRRIASKSFVYWGSSRRRRCWCGIPSPGGIGCRSMIISMR